jgi:ATP synthase protein I
MRPTHKSVEEHEDAELETFGQSVEVKAKRKIRARTVDESIWNWLGMMGLVGWSVTAPSVVGVFLGRWIDQRWPSTVSWTLTLLLAGVGLGCATAWFWVKREGRRG